MLISNLQFLRAFAAINVVYFHVLITAKSYGQEPFYLKFLEGWGQNGVDIFFVISGFVMLHTQYRNRRSITEFLIGRIIRIVPIYWIMTSLMLFLILVLPFLFRETELFSFPHILSSYLFTSGAFLNDWPVVLVGWTLEWEMLFYILFSISLILGSWKQSIAFIGIVLMIIAIYTGGYLALEFILGMVVALLYNERKIGKNLSVILLLFGFFLLFSSLTDYTAIYKVDRLMRWGIPSFFIVYGLVSTYQIKNKLLRYLGDASYSIYLVQVFTIPFFYKMYALDLVLLDNDTLSVFCLVFSVFCGCVLYSYLEKPMTIWLKNYKANNTYKVTLDYKSK